MICFQSSERLCYIRNGNLHYVFFISASRVILLMLLLTKIVWINCNIISTIVYYITYYNLFTAYILYICLVLFYMLAWLFSLEKSLVPNTTFAYIIWFFSCSNSEMKGRVPSFYRFCNKTTEMKDADPDNAHQFHSTPVCFPYYLIFEFDFISLNSAWAICWKSH